MMLRVRASSLALRPQPLRAALVALCATLPTVAQADAAAAPPHSAVVRPQTTLDGWLAETGAVLVKDFYEIGRLSGDGRVNIDAVVFTRPDAQPQEARGLRLEIVASGKPERYETSYVDLDEIAGLSKALQAMAGMAGRWKDADRAQYTEVEFSTKGSLRIGFYQRRREQGAFIAAGPAPAAHAFLDARELPRLRALVDEGLRMLKGR